MSLPELRFDIEWQGADESIRTPELRATWARFGMSVGNDVITLVEDASNQSLRRSINVSLYPLAEWVAFNWWLLRFDSRPAHTLSSARRMVGAGDGFVWPDFEIAPQGQVSELSWRADRIPRRGAQIRYLSGGRALVDSVAALTALASFVDSVVDRLLDAGIVDTVLQREWTRTTALDRDEAEFCEAAARLGLDPFTDGIDLFPAISSAYDDLDGTVRTDFLDGVDPHRLGDSLEWVRKATAIVPETPWPPTAVGLTELRGLVDARFALDEPPWITGWEAARAVRPSLPTTGALALPSVDLATTVHPISGRNLAGLGRASENSAGLVLARAYRPRSSRFHTARALWHALTSSPEASFLLTDAPTASQRIGRAFAAELLVPAADLREYLDDGYSTDAIEDAAEAFDAPADVVRHQVDNQLVPDHG